MKRFNSESVDCAGSSGSSKQPKQSATEPVYEEEEDLDARIRHKNQPVLISVFRDPETEEEKVCVVAALPGGVSNVEFSLIGTGPGANKARITYSWPPIVFDIEGIFRKEIDSVNPAVKLESTHPLILSLKAELRNNRESLNSTPRGEIELTLPIPVQTAASSICRSGGKKNDGSLIVIVELMAYQNSYTVKQKDNTIVFEDL